MILAILQVRYSSTRLPGKALKEILGKPMLLYQLERVKRVKKIDRLIVATSTDKIDDSIEDICLENMVDFFRGSLNDVLDRFYQAAFPYQPEHVVRLTGDCPLSDPEIIDLAIKTHLSRNNDYTSNALKPTFPDGLDVEVIRFSCLKEAWEQATLVSEREHVTPYIYNNPQHFKIENFTSQKDLSSLRWTVDEELDFLLVTKIYEELYTKKSDFTTRDILDYLKLNPELMTLNTRHMRNEGYLKSLKKDLI